MNRVLNIILPVCFFLLGCCQKEVAVYKPSIAALKPNETLVMNYLSCHRGCNTNTVVFRKGEAKLVPYKLDLTAEEVSDLEDYFYTKIDFKDDKATIGRRLDLNEKEIEELDKAFMLEGSNCSQVMKIGFEHKTGDKALNSKGLHLHPCMSVPFNELTPSKLVHYLSDDRMDVPYWRLKEEDSHAWFKQIWEKE